MAIGALISLNRIVEAVFGPLDPAPEHLYWVEVDGLIEAGFIECSGMRVEREVQTVREGGVNDRLHRLPGRASFSNITLRKGVMFSNEMFMWFEQGLANGNVKRRDITIIHYSSYFNIPVRWYVVTNAFPVSWSGPDLRTDSSQIALESLELTFEKLVVEDWSPISFAAKFAL